MTPRHPTRKVLIVEPNQDGHRLQYVAIVIRECLDAGDSVLVATLPSVLNSPEWRMYLAGYESEITVIETPRVCPKEVRRVAIQLGVDHVVVPDGDSFAYSLVTSRAWSGPMTVSALVMRPGGQPSRLPGMTPLKTAVKQAVLLAANRHRNVRIFALKSSVWQGFSVLPTLRDPVSVWPISAGTSLLTERADKRRYWFGVVGVVGERKNLPLIAEALAGMDCSNIGLIVAGRIQSSVLEASEAHLRRISELGGAVKLLDRLLEDQELDNLIADLDCVVLAHSNEGSSGVFGKAAALGTRIIASGARSLKMDCRGVEASAEWVPLRADSIRRALRGATQKDRPLPVPFASPSDFAQTLLLV